MNNTEILEQTLFGGHLSPARIKALAQLAHVYPLVSGEYLYRQGDSPDYFYILASGRLQVMAATRLLGYIGRFEPVGESGVLSGAPREAAVRALRDAVLLRVARTDFMQFLDTCNPALLLLTQLLIKRTHERESDRRQIASGGRGCYALVPASPDVPVISLAQALLKQLRGWPGARLITAAHVDAALGDGAAATALSDSRANRELAAWLDRLEGLHQQLLLVARNDDPTQWTQRCLRYADRILIVAEANSKPATLTALAELPPGAPLAPVELVLLRAEGDAAPHTLGWLAATNARAHYFVHPWDNADLAALARQVTRRGIGLVLGGGGARGFAHIGLLKALRQLDIPIDVMGGTSMGAFIAALAAHDFDPVEMAQIARETFVSNNYLNDYNLPRVSLIRGQRFLGRLREIFGKTRIEELRRSFFCVSTNLSSGGAVIHNRGELAVWVATSMAVPGVAPPVAHEGELLCDGGVADNLPTEALQNMQRGSIIACSVSAEGDIRAAGHGMRKPDPAALLQWRGPGHRPGFSEILLRSATLTSDTIIQKAAIERADVYVHMPVDAVGMFSWAAIDDLIDTGYTHAMAQLEPLRERLLDPDQAATASK